MVNPSRNLRWVWFNIPPYAMVSNTLQMVAHDMSCSKVLGFPLFIIFLAIYIYSHQTTMIFPLHSINPFYLHYRWKALGFHSCIPKSNSFPFFFPRKPRHTLSVKHTPTVRKTYWRMWVGKNHPQQLPESDVAERLAGEFLWTQRQMYRL